MMIRLDFTWKLRRNSSRNTVYGMVNRKRISTGYPIQKRKNRTRKTVESTDCSQLKTEPEDPKSSVSAPNLQTMQYNIRQWKQLWFVSCVFSQKNSRTPVHRNPMYFFTEKLYPSCCSRQRNYQKEHSCKWLLKTGIGYLIWIPDQQDRTGRKNRVQYRTL